MSEAPEPEQAEEAGHLASGRRGRRKILVWGSAGLAVLLAVVVIGIIGVLRHFDANIQQDNIIGMLGSRPVDAHPKAENILVIGSDSRNGLSKAYGSGLVTDQSDTMMIIHIPADRKWAEVMSIPRDSWVNIPACQESNGKMSQPTQFKINEAFATGNLNGNHTSLGVACAVKTLEQDTGIFINHFVVVNFTGLESMVSAVGGVPECNTTPINDPKSGLRLTAGHHMLDPKQALGYVRARYSLGDGSDLERIGRQQAFMSALIGRARQRMYNPVAIFRFLDATTHALTIDSQLGGITGLYNLGESLRNIPSDKIAFFTVPSSPDPAEPADVRWNQPEDSKIFASFRDDIPASTRLFKTNPDATAAPTPTSGSVADREAAVTGATPSPSASPSSAGTASPSSAGTPDPKATPSSIPIQDRTANQSICAG